jgi:hypothetical protein
MAKYSYHQLDANAKAIREGLEAVGATVDPRCPLDYLVGFRGRTYVLEVKTAKGKLREKQTKFLATWKGQAAVVRTLDDALTVIGVL